MNKLGVGGAIAHLRRAQSFLDPFSPVKPDETAFWQQVLDQTHAQFIKRVRDGRGNRLKETPDMFTGLIWNGEQVLALGLIDGYGSQGKLRAMW